MSQYSFAELEKIAEYAEASGLFGTQRRLPNGGYQDVPITKAQALMRVLRGQELGLPPTTALGGIWFSRGKMICDAGTTALLLANHGYVVDDIESTPERCAMHLSREGAKIGKPVSFSMDDARNGGLIKGGDTSAWKAWPQDMLWARCLTRLARRYAAHVFGGSVYAPGEMPEEHSEPDVPQMMNAIPMPVAARKAIEASQSQQEALVKLRLMAVDVLGFTSDEVRSNLLAWAGTHRLADISGEHIEQYITQRIEGSYELVKMIGVDRLESHAAEYGCIGKIPFEVLSALVPEPVEPPDDGDAAARDLFGDEAGIVIAHGKPF
jgi:hypothetical protein